MIPVEDGIPIPPRSTAGRPVKYPYHSMAVGQSFFCETDGVRTSYGKYAKKTGKKFQIRKVTENGMHGYRVWRTA